MLNKIWKWDWNKTAVLMPTLRCPIECEHCLESCTPRSGETASAEMLDRWVRQFIDLDFSPICLTGGEVFYCPNLVQIVSKICAERSTPLVIQTNGFWAASPRQAKETLNRIPYITQLGFSYDKAHMQFIKRAVVENGIAAAYDAGIENVSLSISYQTVPEWKEISDFFKMRFPNITIDAWPIIPIGRALDNDKLNCEAQYYSWDCLPRTCEAQSCFSPIVYPNGDVHLCYHLINCLGNNDPFLIGNLSNNSLTEMLDEISDPLFAFIVAYGGGSLGYLLNELCPELISKKYQRVCQLCYAVFSQPELVARIRELFSIKPFLDRIEEVIQFRKEKSFPVSTANKKEIIVCKGANCLGNKDNSHLRNYLLNRLVDSGKYRKASIKYVDCLKSCKEGPNIKLANSRTIIHHLDLEKINAILEYL